MAGAGDERKTRVLTVMNVNYAGTVHAVKSVLPGMVERDFGQVIVLGSLVIPGGRAPYTARRLAPTLLWRLTNRLQ